ncbi:MFS transporter [Nocardioides sp. OK12]|uniref:MFS transporter n=1 Tax=Nocardioides sp. OK12 TaxID=2758661 RepID=UPI0021C31749|nr:MFS transporter [Nocardioides sp. OK12]GHJ61092.1 MFS transporter [Nocardioides sp. OK12]
MAGERFGRFWAAATISSFGTAVTAVAMPVLVVRELEASALAVGVVNAAQFLPYAALGLVAGAYADRWRRQRVLVWSSLGRALALGAIPVLWASGLLGVWSLVVLLLAFGAFSVFGFAATQSLLPRLVPRCRLVAANARLDQGDASAQTFGPALGGGLVGLLGAPVAIAVDAVSYLVDALLNARLGIDDSPPERTADRHLRREIGEGLRWTYRHPTLGPLAVSTHVWFLANGAAFTALAIVALREMALPAVVFGLLVATGGVARLLGATLAPAMGRRLGTGPTIITTRAVHPGAWVLVAIAPQVPAGVALLGAALALQGLAMGAENANDTGYWQLVTPDRQLGRANATRRSVNRTAGALGAILGGAALTVFDQGPTLLGIAAVFGISAVIVALSPIRRVRSV